MIFVGNRGCVPRSSPVNWKKLTPHEGLAEHLQPNLYPASAGGDYRRDVGNAQAYGGRTRYQLWSCLLRTELRSLRLYGQRTEGEPEQNQWRRQIDALTPEGLAA